MRTDHLLTQRLLIAAFFVLAGSRSSQAQDSNVPRADLLAQQAGALLTDFAAEPSDVSQVGYSASKTCSSCESCSACQSCRSGCCRRGTLLQWSYGTSFSGGPDLDEPLVTDRPDFTEASVTVGEGVSQLEFGYTYIYDNEAGESTRTQSLGEALLRYGIFADWLEFRIQAFPVEQQTNAAGIKKSTSGMEDMYVGFKIALTPQEGCLPEMALLPQAFVPAGSKAFTREEVLPGLNWIYSWELTDNISTAGSTQVNRAIDDMTTDAHLLFAQSWTVAYSLCENLGAYTEWFALIRSSADTDRTTHFFNGGFTYLISDDVQWDIRAGVGLNGAAADYFFGSGLSIRYQ